MKRTSRIIIAAVAAAALVFAVVYATSGGPSKVAGKPVRALGAGGDADADLAVGSGGAPAVPVTGTTASPNHTQPLTKITNRPPTTVPWVKRELEMEAEEAAAEAAGEEAEGDKPALEGAADLGQADEALQTDRGSSQFPAPSLSFKGLGANANPYSLVPPDTNGDVGNGYYLQMVNTVFAVYDADTGAKLAGPTVHVVAVRRRHAEALRDARRRRPGRGVRRVRRPVRDQPVRAELQCAEVRGVRGDLVDEQPAGRVGRLPVRLPERVRAERLPEVRRVAVREQQRVLRLVQPVPVLVQHLRLRVAGRRGDRLRPRRR